METVLDRLRADLQRRGYSIWHIARCVTIAVYQPPGSDTVRVGASYLQLPCITNFASGSTQVMARFKRGDDWDAQVGAAKALGYARASTEEARLTRVALVIHEALDTDWPTPFHPTWRTSRRRKGQVSSLQKLMDVACALELAAEARDNQNDIRMALRLCVEPKL